MWIFFLLFATLFGEETTEVSSDYAEYRDGVLRLKENVAIHHPFGLIKCDHGELQPNRHQAMFRSAPLRQAYARGNVELHLNGRGTLHCYEAWFHLEKQTGRFRSRRVGEPVVYEGYGPLPSSDPITLAADEMRLSVDPEGELVLRQLEAEGKVHLVYQGDTHVYAGLARYEVIDEVQTIELFPKVKQPCEVRDRNGNRIQANRILVLPDQQRVLFDRPQGDLYVLEGGAPSHRVRFSSQHMTWSAPEQKLTLMGMVRVDQPGVGTMDAEDRLVIEYQESEGEYTLTHVKSVGRTQLEYFGDAKTESHTLLCNGRSHIDNTRREVSLKGEGQQVIFTDRMGIVTSNEVVLNYSQLEEQLALNQLTLRGNVTLENVAPFDPNDKQPVHQYAVADLVEYLPEQHRMDLLSGEETRVLYYDRVNQIQMSAPGIRLQRDAQTQKEFVQGLGDVRFTLMKPELEALNAHFHPKPPSEAIR